MNDLPKIEEFQYQLELTKYLDNLDGNYSFTKDDIYKITLWKVGRFPNISQEALIAFNKLANYNSLYTAKVDVEIALTELLKCKGVRLPMASTYLRFRNPKVFQIIDWHVWNQVKIWDKSGTLNQYPDELATYNQDASKQIKLYFDYLKVLRDMCGYYRVKFEDADRIFYLKDKHEKKNN